MNAIKFETTVDESVAGAMPKLRPMLGRRIEVIALEASPTTTRRPKTLDDFSARRLKRPADVEQQSLEAIEAAIERGRSESEVQIAHRGLHLHVSRELWYSRNGTGR